MSELSRIDKILNQIDPSAPGIEIGPSFRPVLPKSKHPNVITIDHLDKEKLKEKYKSEVPDLIHNIEDVDYIWTGQPIHQLVPKKVHWIIASHVIEHVPDFVGFLNSCAEALTQNGKISLVVPDKRFCFDAERENTSLAAILDARGRTNHTFGQTAEHFLKTVKLNSKIAWDSTETGNPEAVHDLPYIQHVLKTYNPDQYTDIHAWVFTPISFRRLILDLNTLGIISLKEVCFFETEGHEFYITLARV